MRIRINIETGDLGMTAGCARSKREGNEYNIMIDPSRISAGSVEFVVTHELRHAVHELITHATNQQPAPKSDMIREMLVGKGFTLGEPFKMPNYTIEDIKGFLLDDDDDK